MDSSKFKVKTGENLFKDILFVKHKELERVSEHSVYRSSCLVCKTGILPVCRDQKTFELIPDDNCLLCGQRYHYTDFESMP